MARKVIGIDLGHCETAAAMPSRKTVDGRTVNEAKTLVTNQGNVQVMPTQIILTNEQMQKLKGHKRPDFALLDSIGPFKTGDLGSYVEDGERFFYFKAVPKDFDEVCARTKVGKDCEITHAMVMACYVHAIVKNIFTYNFTEMNQEDRPESTLLIGCPTTADWTAEEAREDYADLVKTATGVKDALIIPESRAAMFSSVDSGISKISAMNGAVVFDFGSSTADCTYMLLGRKIIEFSWALGASEVERQMTREALIAAVEEYGHFMPDAASVADSDAEFRKHKEAYYEGKYQPYGKKINSEFVNSADGMRLEPTVRVDKKFMDKVTNVNSFTITCDSTSTRTGSWQQLCREFFQEARKQIGAATHTRIGEDGILEQIPCTVDTVVLTGGASKMDFIYTICREVFPEEDIRIELNTVNPSHTVSNGLAWVSIADENLESCKATAKNAVMEDKACGTSVLWNSLSDALFKEVTSFTMSEVKKWADAPGDSMTVEQLQNALTNGVKDPKVQKNFEDACSNAVKSWKAKLSASMGVAINTQVEKLYSPAVAESLVIPRDVWADMDASVFGLESINVKSLFVKINFNGLGRKIALTAVRIVIWLAAGAAAFETLGLSIVAGAIAHALADVFISDEDLKKPRTRDDRQKIAAKLEKELKSAKGEIMKDVNKAFEDQMKSFKDTVDSTLDTAFKIVTLQKFEV